MARKKAELFQQTQGIENWVRTNEMILIGFSKTDFLSKKTDIRIAKLKSTVLTPGNSVHPVNIVLVKYLKFFSLEFESGSHESGIRIPETRLTFSLTNVLVTH